MTEKSERSPKRSLRDYIALILIAGMVKRPDYDLTNIKPMVEKANQVADAIIAEVKRTSRSRPSRSARRPSRKR